MHHDFGMGVVPDILICSASSTFCGNADGDPISHSTALNYSVLFVPEDCKLISTNIELMQSRMPDYHLCELLGSDVA